jgi:hypothetical protein
MDELTIGHILTPILCLLVGLGVAYLWLES